MNRSRKRLLLLLCSLPFVVLAFALMYMYGMMYLEGEERTFWQSLGWAAETLTTTGYGQDAGWKHPGMVLFAILLQFIGVFLIFLIFPIYLIPFLEEHFEARLPTTAGDLKNHVLIYRYGPPVISLIQELEGADIKTLVIEDDENLARRLFDQGIRILHGDLENGILQAANLKHCRAMIVNSTDDENAAVILAARQLDFEGKILAVVETPSNQKPILLTGASSVFTPRHMLAKALAEKASPRIDSHISGLRELGDKLKIWEIPIKPKSALVGRTLAQAQIGSRFGVTVIAQWSGGMLHPHPSTNLVLKPYSILLVVGAEKNLQQLADVAGSVLSRRTEGHFVIGGYGEVGRKVDELLKAVGEKVTAVDIQRRNEIVCIGSIIDPRTLEKINIKEARALILALSTDSETLFATVVIKDLVPDLPIIARVNRTENLERIYLAGADFALSISQVSGQILARSLLGEESMTIDSEVQLCERSATRLEGYNPKNLRIREKTGCSVVAVERNEVDSKDLIVYFGSDFRFKAEDKIFICGSSHEIHRFNEEFGQPI